MNNSDSTKIFISLKLIPQRRDGTFFPFVHFQEACYIFLQKLYPLFQNSKNPEDIHPLLGEYFLSCPPIRKKTTFTRWICFLHAGRSWSYAMKYAGRQTGIFLLTLRSLPMREERKNSSFRDPARFRTPLPGQESMKKEPPVSATPWKRESIKIP